ncbi:hypothetical protein OSB04_012039 [Centaurea solstitialis]|uniref:Uncharacterized protein n=1 Tax=Centaurea solstitialis TaxID=347529 RepID=A0AA38TMD9_9ASTR|nr:hypothetical protein OSB04_012039 [Centaurea solstitialis]
MGPQGWGDCLLTNRSYHFIVHNDARWVHPLEQRALDIKTHILHGLIHSDGFGQILSLNESEGGSRFLSGEEVLDLWDRICISLNSRKISLIDVSHKRTIDLRFLSRVSYRSMLFGRKGYEFRKGNLGVSRGQYNETLGHLHALKLNRDSKRLINRYQRLIGQIPTNTKLGDALRSILEKMHGEKSKAIDHPPPPAPKPNPSIEKAN